MKVYKDSYYCFACGRSGDIYSLVEALDGCDFKPAFIKLGGTYEKMTNREKKNSRVSWNHSKESTQINEIGKAEYEQVFWSCLDIIHYSNKLQPYSNTWCEIKNFEPLLKSWLDEYEDRREVNVNVYTKCCEFRQKFNFTRINIERAV